MAIVRKYGKPDLFITFTCNPKWPETVDNIPSWLKANNRPDLVVRVIQAKLKQLFRDIIVNSVFGNIDAYMYTIEFQNRGLPHAHSMWVSLSCTKTASCIQLTTSTTLCTHTSLTQKPIGFYSTVSRHTWFKDLVDNSTAIVRVWWTTGVQRSILRNTAKRLYMFPTAITRCTVDRTTDLWPTSEVTLLEMSLLYRTTHICWFSTTCT